MLHHIALHHIVHSNLTWPLALMALISASGHVELD